MEDIDSLEGGLVEGLGPNGRPMKFYVVAITRTPKMKLEDRQNSHESPDMLHDVPLPRQAVEDLMKESGLEVSTTWPQMWQRAAKKAFDKIDGMDRDNLRANGEGYFRWDIRRQRLLEQPENLGSDIEQLTRAKAILRLRTMWDFFRKMDPHLRMILLNYEGDLPEDGFASLPDEKFAPWTHPYTTKDADGGVLLKPVFETSYPSAEFRKKCGPGAQKDLHGSVRNWTTVWTGDEDVDAMRYSLGLGPVLAQQAALLPTETRRSALFDTLYTTDDIVNIDGFRANSNVDGNIRAGIVSMLDDYDIRIVSIAETSVAASKLESLFEGFAVHSQTLADMTDPASDVYSTDDDDDKDKAFAGAYLLMHGSDVEGAIWFQSWDKCRESKVVEFSGTPDIAQAMKNSLYMRAYGTSEAYERWLPFLQVWGLLDLARKPYTGLIARVPFDGKGPNMHSLTASNEYLGLQRCFSLGHSKMAARETLKALQTSKTSRSERNLSNFDFASAPPFETLKIAYVSPEADKLALVSARRAGITTSVGSWKNADIQAYYAARIFPTAEFFFGMYILLRLTDASEIGGGYASDSSFGSVGMMTFIEARN